MIALRSFPLLTLMVHLCYGQFEEQINHLTEDVPPVRIETRSREQMFRDMLNSTRIMSNGDRMYQMDMRMSVEDMEFYYGIKSAPANRILWPSGIIPYRISESSQQDAEVIRAAVKHWTENSCLRFRELDASDFTQDYVNFFQGDGCWSRFGRVGNRQNISIGAGCGRLETVVHEIGHAIGFLHEQSRRDRDRYINVKYGNIQGGATSQFDPDPRRRIRYGARYDYTSVMHYSQYAFTVGNDLKTLTTLNPLNAYLISRGNGLSFRDRKKANYLYNCSASCTNPPRCLNEGFVDQNCKCICPENALGETCETLRGPYYPRPPCGGFIVREGELSSPDRIEFLENFLRVCIWWIQAPRDRRVRLTVNEFRTSDRFREFCYGNSLEIRTNSLYNGQTFCGQELQAGMMFTSEKRDMILEYSLRRPPRDDFSIKIEFVPQEESN